MADLPTSPFRSLESFGVSGLLQPEAKVLFQPLSGPESLGRISDLISLKLKSSGLSELSLRNALLRVVFVAFSPLSTKRSVTLEVGFDSKYVAICASFVSTAEPNPEFLFGLLGELASGSFIRWQPTSQRLELAILMGVDALAPGRRVITIPKKALKTPAPAQYLALSDLEKLELPVFQRDASFFARTGQWIQDAFAKPGAEVSLEQTPPAPLAVAPLTPPAVAPLAGLPEGELTFESVSESLDSVAHQLRERATQSAALARAIRPEIKTAETQALFDSWVNSLDQEREQTRTVILRVSNYLIQRETLFRKGEEISLAAVREKEELLKQKAIAIANLTEKLSRAMTEVERLRNKGLSSDDLTSLKAKFVQMARELASAKAQNTALTARVSELGSLRGGGAGDALDVKSKAEIEELKKKLTLQTKTIANQKRDMERLNSLVEERRKQEVALKAELNRAQTELTRLKKRVA